MLRKEETPLLQALVWKSSLCPVARVLLVFQGTSAFTALKILSSPCVYRTSVCVALSFMVFRGLILSPALFPSDIFLYPLTVNADTFLAAKVTQWTTVDLPCWNLPPSGILAVACASALDSLPFTPRESTHSAQAEFRCCSHVFCLCLFSSE